MKKRSMSAKAVIKTIAVALFASPILAATSQLLYSYATNQDQRTHDFIVTITSTSTVRLFCTVHYKGTILLNSDKSGKRFIYIPPVRSNSHQVVRSIEFPGFRSFTATVQCQTK